MVNIYKKRYKIKKRKEGAYNRGNKAAQSARYRVKYKLKVAAHGKVYYAIKGGILAKPEECSRCGSKDEIVAHHKDYNKPLEIEWMCVTCHNEEHGNFKEDITKQLEKEILNV